MMRCCGSHRWLAIEVSLSGALGFPDLQGQWCGGLSGNRCVQTPHRPRARSAVVCRTEATRMHFLSGLQAARTARGRGGGTDSNV